METDKEKKKNLYILKHIYITSINFGTEYWNPSVYTSLYDDYYKAVGHLTEEFSQKLDLERRNARNNSKPEPVYTQEPKCACIRCGLGENNWSVDQWSIESIYVE